MHQNKDKPSSIPFFSRHLLLSGTSQDIILVGLIILGGIFLYLWGVGSYALWDPWEPKYAQTMREMMARHDFITPYYVDYVRWTKPIFIYWAMYLPVRFLGNNELAVRLPSIVAAILSVLLVYHFLKKLRGRRNAMMAACILGTIPQYFYMARQAMPDMLLTLFLGAAMGFFALARFGKDHKNRYLVLFYISIALAFLSKGPVALVITLGALLLFGMISIDFQRFFTGKAALNDIKSVFKRYHVVYGLLIIIVVGSPWYIAMFIKYGADFIENFLCTRISFDLKNRFGGITVSLPITCEPFFTVFIPGPACCRLGFYFFSKA